MIILTDLDGPWYALSHGHVSDRPANTHTHVHTSTHNSPMKIKRARLSVCLVRVWAACHVFVHVCVHVCVWCDRRYVGDRAVGGTSHATCVAAAW